MAKKFDKHLVKELQFMLAFSNAIKPTLQPMMKFSQLICWGEPRLEPKFKKKICKTDFELFLISHSLSLQKICLTDFYFTSHEC